MTPHRRRQAEHNAKNVDKFWRADSATKELRRVNAGLLTRRKHTLAQLYDWMNFSATRETFVRVGWPLDHDNMAAVVGMPRKWSLANGWTIPPDEVKHLSDGPLTDENGKLLVPQKHSRFKLMRVLVSGLAIAAATLFGLLADWDPATEKAGKLFGIVKTHLQGLGLTEGQAIPRTAIEK